MAPGKRRESFISLVRERTRACAGRFVELVWLYDRLNDHLIELGPRAPLPRDEISRLMMREATGPAVRPFAEAIVWADACRDRGQRFVTELLSPETAAHPLLREALEAWRDRKAEAADRILASLARLLRERPDLLEAPPPRDGDPDADGLAISLLALELEEALLDAGRDSLAARLSPLSRLIEGDDAEEPVIAPDPAHDPVGEEDDAPGGASPPDAGKPPADTRGRAPDDLHVPPALVFWVLFALTLLAAILVSRGGAPEPPRVPDPVPAEGTAGTGETRMLRYTPAGSGETRLRSGTGESELSRGSSPVGLRRIPVFPARTHPGRDFWRSGGLDLAAAVAADGTSLLRRHHGLMRKGDRPAVERYLRQALPKVLHSPDVAWAVVDLDTGDMLGWRIDQVFSGASVVKVFPMATLFDKMKGKPRPDQIRQILPMIAKSSNDAWSRVILACAPDGESGPAAYRTIQAFLARSGYTRTQGGRSSVGAGPNRLVARDLGKYLYDLHHKNLPGSEAQMKLLTTCATAARKGYRYIPEHVYGGGKTGTWSTVAHDLRFYEIGGRRVAIAVLTDLSSDPGFGRAPTGGAGTFRDEAVAVLHGGLFLSCVQGALPRPAPPRDTAKLLVNGNYATGRVRPVAEGRLVASLR